MATKPEETDANDELPLDDQVDEAGDEADNADAGEESAGDDDNAEGEDEEILTFGDELTDAKPDDSSLIKHLREELKKARKAAPPTPAAKPIELGPKPTLADFDYDEDKYDEALDRWKSDKATVERQTADSTEQQQREAEAWQGEIKRYKDDLGSLGYADAQSAEETVVAALTDVQQAILVKVADRPGRLLYALAKNPDRLAQLASVTDPLKFAGQIARQEGQLKVTKRRKAPEPEKIERGSGSTIRSTDKELEKLEKEADRTGDRTKLVAYKKKLKEAGKA